jgi:Subtilase family
MGGLSILAGNGATDDFCLLLEAALLPSHDMRSYTILSGTSMASPHMAGCAALLLQARPQILAADVRNALQVGGLTDLCSCMPPSSAWTGRQVGEVDTIDKWPDRQTGGSPTQLSFNSGSFTTKCCWKFNPWYGCRLWAKCPDLDAKQDQWYPLGSRYEGAAAAVCRTWPRASGTEWRGSWSCSKYSICGLSYEI